MWQGIEGADSLVLNAHKWLGADFDCSLYYVRDAEHLVRVLSTNPSYLQSAADERVKNLRDWGLPLGRRFRALKLWCLLRAEGVSGLQARLRDHFGTDPARLPERRGDRGRLPAPFGVHLTTSGSVRSGPRRRAPRWRARVVSDAHGRRA